jgi:hypothetical protein
MRRKKREGDEGLGEGGELRGKGRVPKRRREQGERGDEQEKAGRLWRRT